MALSTPRSRVASAAAGALVALAACGAPPAPAVEVGTEPWRDDYGVVTVRGVNRRALRGEGWTRALVVSARPPGAADAAPALAGRHEVVEGAARFTPSFAPAAGLEYVVRLDTPLVAAPVVRRWRLAEPRTRMPSTRVRAVHPSAEVVPENLLRFYVEFSAPMREGEATKRLRLVDGDGREIERALLEVERELWDPERRRLTVLLDPGRVKRGIRTNVELGPPLRAGGRYALRIDSLWPDARGVPLAAAHEQRFRAGPADRRRPDPSRWTLSAPAVGSRDTLLVAFGEPLDHALAAHLLEVVDAEGRAVGGVVALDDADRRWRFAPVDRWRAGPYELRAAPALEDLAGNAVGRVFDADLERGESARSESRAPAAVSFTPRPADFAR